MSVTMRPGAAEVNPFPPMVHMRITGGAMPLQRLGTHSAPEEASTANSSGTATADDKAHFAFQGAAERAITSSSCDGEQRPSHGALNAHRHDPEMDAAVEGSAERLLNPFHPETLEERHRLLLRSEESMMRSVLLTKYTQGMRSFRPLSATSLLNSSLRTPHRAHGTAKPSPSSELPLPVASARIGASLLSAAQASEPATNAKRSQVAATKSVDFIDTARQEATQRVEGLSNQASPHLGPESPPETAQLASVTPPSEHSSRKVPVRSVPAAGGLKIMPLSGSTHDVNSSSVSDEHSAACVVVPIADENGSPLAPLHSVDEDELTAETKNKIMAYVIQDSDIGSPKLYGALKSESAVGSGVPDATPFDIKITHAHDEPSLQVRPAQQDAIYQSGISVGSRSPLELNDLPLWQVATSPFVNGSPAGARGQQVIFSSPTEQVFAAFNYMSENQRTANNGGLRVSGESPAGPTDTSERTLQRSLSTGNSSYLSTRARQSKTKLNETRGRLDIEDEEDESRQILFYALWGQPGVVKNVQRTTLQHEEHHCRRALELTLAEMLSCAISEFNSGEDTRIMPAWGYRFGKLSAGDAFALEIGSQERQRTRSGRGAAPSSVAPSQATKPTGVTQREIIFTSATDALGKGRAVVASPPPNLQSPTACDKTIDAIAAIEHETAESLSRTADAAAADHKALPLYYRQQYIIQREAMLRRNVLLDEIKAWVDVGEAAVASMESIPIELRSPVAVVPEANGDAFGDRAENAPNRGEGPAHDGGDASSEPHTLAFTPKPPSRRPSFVDSAEATSSVRPHRQREANEIDERAAVLFETSMRDLPSMIAPAVEVRNGRPAINCVSVRLRIAGHDETMDRAGIEMDERHSRARLYKLSPGYVASPKGELGPVYSAPPPRIN